MHDQGAGGPGKDAQADRALDPEIRAAIEAAAGRVPAVDWLRDPPETLRANYAAARQNPVPLEPAPQEVAVPAPDGARPALLFGQPGTPTILYCHGGGWMAGSPLTHAPVTAALARESGLAVLSLDYRLAPEHPAPAPVEDGLAAMAWLAEQGVGAVVLAGDSAGAAITLACERAARPPVPDVMACLAFYGAFGLADSPSMRLFHEAANGVDRHAIARMYAAARGKAAAFPYDAEDLAQGRAPLWVLAAELDPFRDDSLCLAELATLAGRPTTLLRMAGVPHAFLQYVGRASVADEAVSLAAEWLGKTIADISA